MNAMEQLAKELKSPLHARQAVLIGRLPEYFKTPVLKKILEEERGRIFEKFNAMQLDVANMNQSDWRSALEVFLEENSVENTENAVSFVTSLRLPEEQHRHIELACEELVRGRCGNEAMDELIDDIRLLLQRLTRRSDFGETDVQKFREETEFVVHATPAWMIPMKLEQGIVPSGSGEETQYIWSREGHYTPFGYVSLGEIDQAYCNWHWSWNGVQLLCDCREIDPEQLYPPDYHNDVAMHPTHEGTVPSDALKAVLFGGVIKGESGESRYKKSLLSIALAAHAIRKKRIAPIFPADVALVLKCTESSASRYRINDLPAARKELFECITPRLPDAVIKELLDK